VVLKYSCRKKNEFLSKRNSWAQSTRGMYLRGKGGEKIREEKAGKLSGYTRQEVRETFKVQKKTRLSLLCITSDAWKSQPECGGSSSAFPRAARHHFRASRFGQTLKQFIVRKTQTESHTGLCLKPRGRQLAEYGEKPLPNPANPSLHDRSE